MGRTRFLTKTIRGSKVPLYVNDEGTFEADVLGETVERSSLDALVSRLTTMLKVETKSVPVSRLVYEGYGAYAKKPEFKMVELTGIHSGTKRLLIRDGSKSEQVSSAYGDLYTLLTKTQQDEYWSLQKEREKAEKALEAWKLKYKITTETAYKLLNIESDVDEEDK